MLVIKVLSDLVNKHAKAIEQPAEVNLALASINKQTDKIALSAFDNKRWILDDGITTLAHGHYKTNDLLG